MKEELKDALEKVGLKMTTPDHFPTTGLARVVIATKMSADPKFSDLNFLWKTKRQTELKAGSFHWDSDVLYFEVVTRIPDRESKFYDNSSDVCIVTSFPDFCWRLSHGTTPENVDQVSTRIDKEMRDRRVELGDLTWAIPSKFADDLIELLHVLNSTVFEGILDEAIIYGPL